MSGCSACQDPLNQLGAPAAKVHSCPSLDSLGRQALPWEQPHANDMLIRVQGKVLGLKVGQVWGAHHAGEVSLGSGRGCTSADPESLPGLLPLPA